MASYIGRFAPSPTGQLHIGSLIGALASFLDARSQRGKWLLRMEDLDPPREPAGAANAILASLQQHGLQWDGDVLWQSHQHNVYQQVIDQLLAAGQAYYCSCSRRELQASGGIYPGTCRGSQHQPAGQACAVRLQVTNDRVDFEDSIQGHYGQQLQQQVGDFVVKRKDGLFAYQLAVVVDDECQGVNHIVRGSDLLESTPRQIFLQQLLGFPTPRYSHIPIITNQQGQKLSKQTFARALTAVDACENLLTALGFLKQPLPPVEQCQRVEDIIEWAVGHWSLQRIPRTRAIASTR